MSTASDCWPGWRLWAKCLGAVRPAPCPLGRAAGSPLGHGRQRACLAGGKIKVPRPRVRDLAGKEMKLASWQALSDPDLPRAWAMTLMVLKVSTRKYGRAVRLPAGDPPAVKADATSKSAVSRRFVALTRKKLKAWLGSDLSAHDLLVIQIDGQKVGDHLLVAAIRVDGEGHKHVLGIAEGATENAATVQALLDNLTDRGLEPEIPRLFIVDGAKALSKAIRGTFGATAAIQRCQIHKGRNIVERLDEHLHASVKKALRQAWEQDDAAKAERLLRNLARRLELQAPGVSASILEASTRSSPSSGSGYRTNRGDLWPAPMRSRTPSAQCGPSPATSSDGLRVPTSGRLRLPTGGTRSWALTPNNGT